MNNINSVGSKPGVRHAYAYGHAKKELAKGFKDEIFVSEDKSTTAKSFKDLLANADVKPEKSSEVEQDK